MNAYDIGVVIIGRNEGERLIASLTSAKSDANHMVYVDSGSTDNSIAAAEGVGAVVVRLDMSTPFTAARARNAGFNILKARCSEIRFVQFLDGDCVLVRGWLDKALAFIEQRNNTAVVCGRRREQHPEASVYNRLCDLEWDTPIGECLSCGGDALIRVDALEAVGGYNPQLIAGEEPELCVRLREAGWHIWRLDAEMTLHDAAMKRFGQWWVRAVRCGYAYAEVSRIHRAAPSAIWRRETRRAVIWGGLLPAVVCFASVIYPAAIGGALIYLLQICRIALARRPNSSFAWKYAVFVTIAKFAEFQGITKFYWRNIRRKSVTLIEYK